MNYDETIRNRRRLKIPGYQRQETVVTRQLVFPPNGMSSGEWYEKFEQRFMRALRERQFLPVFRSSHGEYSFVTGARDWPHDTKLRMKAMIAHAIRSIKYQSTFYSSGLPGYCETYPWWTIGKLRRDFAGYLKMISEQGVHCMYLSDRDSYPSRLHRRFLGWMNQNNIKTSAESYGHIYFVYALFNGVHLPEIITGRRVLVVTSNMGQRTKALLEQVAARGASDVHYIPISSNHSMMDTIVVPQNLDPGLCLIGAGVGASNILNQLKHLRCPCVDAGYVLDAMSDRQLKRRRIYCVNDEEWTEFFGEGTPDWAGKFGDQYSEFADVRSGGWTEDARILTDLPRF